MYYYPIEIFEIGGVMLFRFLSTILMSICSLSFALCSECLPLPTKPNSLNERLAKANADIFALEDSLENFLREEENEWTSMKLDDYSVFQIAGHSKILFLDHELAQELVARDAKGKIIQNCFHDCLTHPISYASNMYFKTNIDENDTQINGKIPVVPLDFPREQAAYYFQRLLVGEGISPTTFCIFKNVKFRDSKQNTSFRTLFCQVSRGIKGATFHEYLEGMTVPDIEDLDHKSVSASGLTHLLLCSSDAKGENFIVDANEKLIAVDSDMFSLSPVYYLDSPELIKRGLVNQFKSVLFLMPSFLKSYPHADIQLLVMNTPRAEFLYMWLQSMVTVDQKIRTIENFDFLGSTHLKKQNFPLQFNMERIRVLSFQLAKLQFWLKRGVTFGDLFRNLHPLSYAYYREVIKKEQKNFENPNDLVGEIYYHDVDQPPRLIDYLKGKQAEYFKDGRTTYRAFMELEQSEKLMRIDSKIYTVELILDKLFEVDPLTSSISLRKRTDLADYLEKNKNIASDICTLNQMRLSYEQGFILKNFFAFHHNVLRFLDLRENFLPPNAAYWISPLLFTQRNLIDINLCDNDLRASGMKKLALELPKLPHLKKFNLSGNYMEDKGVRYLAMVVGTQLPKLEELFLAENNLSDESLSYILKIAQNLSSLTVFDLRWNRMSDEELYSLNRQCPLRISKFLIEDNIHPKHEDSRYVDLDSTDDDS